MDIIIDTKGEAELVTRDRLIESDDDDLDFENTGNSLRPPFRRSRFETFDSFLILLMFTSIEQAYRC